MPTTGVEIPSNLKERIEDAVDEGDYTSNSDLIRYAVRRLLDRRDERLSEQAVRELNRRLDYGEDELLTPEELEEKVEG
jgi:Arc/MetJ-type ribon-helix-helix transcriptional regulator